MKIITVANQKGGTAKTTTALCLGAELEYKGYSVLYVDLDKQCDTSRTLMADLTKPGSYDIMADRKPANEVVQITENGHHVITSSDKMANVDALLNDPKNQIGKEQRLKDSLATITEPYDYIVIDTATDLNVSTINALTCSDYLVISTTADSFSEEGLITLLNITDVIRRYTNPGLQTTGILFARYSPRLLLNRAIREETSNIASRYGTKVFNTYIRENSAIRESQAFKEPITEYAPKSNGHLDYLAFTNELLETIRQ